MKKPKLALYWASSCGGCEIAVVNLHERLLDLDAHFELFFCPCLVDTKKSEVEALPDRSLAIALFNGGIRTEENLEMARLLRRKSELLIAFGSCATEGCIPGLANLSSRDEILETTFQSRFATGNAEGVRPCTEFEAPEGKLALPRLLDKLSTLRDVTEVDYYLPGCPPEPDRIWEVLEGIIKGEKLPPTGATVGAGRAAVCDECEKKREDKALGSFKRIWQIIPDPDLCLLDQGILCMGVATRDGCGAPCPTANMPCTGCYGLPEGVSDQGAKMVAALGSIVDLSPIKEGPKDQVFERIDEIMGSIQDPVGTFYKYSLAASYLKGRDS